ncbi:T9SS type A sorting domain-containing protein [Parabacteroides sp.]
MKIAKLFLLLMLHAAIPGAYAQISEGGLPPSFDFPTSLRSEQPVVEIPVNFSVEDQKTVDAWRTSQGAPLAVAKRIPADLDINHSGEWLTLPDGTRIWQLRLRAKGAIALTLYYSDFHIPEGGKLFIYNADKTQVLGAFTGRTNPPTRKYATGFVAGDDLILEYAAAPSGEMPRLRIEGIGYGYNHLSVSTRSNSRVDKDWRVSGPCMVNINCEEGADWQNQKKGVCHMIQLINGISYICSASLVNNTAKDKKPYILSAFHCHINPIDNTSTTSEEFNQWIFVFDREYTGCSNESERAEEKSMVGCSLKAISPTQGGSDGLLLLLNQRIPDDYDVFYNGWDRTNSISLSGVGIHHPNGDYKKISTYGNYPTISTTWLDVENQQAAATYAHWYATFDATLNGHGVTEGGSSGSPLFNQDGLIIGTLTGGNSTCDYLEGSNLYGKFYFHWDQYGTEDSCRMDVWLDPSHTGATRLAGMTQDGKTIPILKAPEELTAQKRSDGILLEWSAPLYTQNIAWGTQTLWHRLGLRGTPFYYGQRWEPTDLKPIHKKTITDVCLIPVESASYAIYIKQGNREYRQDVIDSTPMKNNRVTLREPFVIDSDQELIVAIQVKEYDESVLPAPANKGPATYGKGNIFSEDGKTWEMLSKDNLDVDFILSAVVSSEEGELPAGLRAASYAPVKLSEYAGDKLSILRSDITASYEGNSIRAFPEITGYNVYRDQAQLADLPPSQTQYTDKKAVSDSYLYAVTAQYNEEEGRVAEASVGGTVGIEDVEENPVEISPIVFSTQVRISNSARVDRLEIYSANGKLMNSIRKPGEIVDTAALPQGMYVFLLYTDKGTQTIQAIRE